MSFLVSNYTQFEGEVKPNITTVWKISFYTRGMRFFFYDFLKNLIIGIKLENIYDLTDDA